MSSPDGSGQPVDAADLAVRRSEIDRLRRDLDRTRELLADSEETLRAIRHGEVDALVVTTLAGHENLFTLSGADSAYRTFVENMTDGAATVSADGIVLYANQALANLVQSTCHQIVGRPVLELVSPASRSRLAHVIGPTSAGGAIDVNLMTSIGSTVPVLIGSSPSLSSGGETLTCITVTDVTSEHRARLKLAHAAEHDALTGLPNRALLADRIQHALDRRASAKTFLALLFCDIDLFKNINDAYGHEVGDDVLRIVARRVSAAVRPEDTVARIGGDEFIVLCEDLDDPADALLLASRVRAAVAEPFTAGTTDLEITISIGISIASAEDDATPDSVLRDADEAMYSAKRQGANAIEVSDEQLRLVATSRLRLLSEMRHAAFDGQLRLRYQPVVRIADETIVGVEALVRWQHPTRGLIPPDEFIPFAERSGLIAGIGAWVMREACHQAAAWKQAAPGARQVQMAVNVSGRQFAQGAGLVELVRLSLEESGADPTALVLEVTESALMDDAAAALRILNELKALGVSLSIDDFGTGYSSLVYLKRFPVDVLKIDRSFIAGLGRSHDDAAIVQSVIDLARSFGIDAVAEGVENPQQLAILQELGCAFGQGYLWSPAEPAADLGRKLFVRSR
jgi:diguanylate cyclase (GGDEF)-like protein/PAS domain S-box-containing protein